MGFLDKITDTVDDLKIKKMEFGWKISDTVSDLKRKASDQLDEKLDQWQEEHYAREDAKKAEKKQEMSESEYKNSKPLEMLPSNVKKAYIKVIINFMLFDDNKIDEKEFNELYKLITRIKFTSEERLELLDYCTKPFDTKKLMREMQNEVDEATAKSIVFSLVKDMIYINSKVKYSDNYSDNTFIKKFSESNKISSDALRFFEKTLENEQKLFDDNIDDKALEKGFRELISSAGAVSIPLAAVYFSGSVVGLGATGITSGLAALGFGGILGFSSMVTGIGAILLIGIGAKKGIEHLTGQSELDKRKHKELLLMEVSKHQQRTINIILEDINSINKKLCEAIYDAFANKEQTSRQKECIDKLIERLRLLSVSGENTSKDKINTDKCVVRQSLPLQINKDKLDAITSDENSAVIYAILECYDPESLTLKANLSLDKTENLVTALNALGYFSVSALGKQAFATIRNAVK